MLKTKDLSLVAVVIIITTVLALIVANTLFKTSKVATRVEVVEPITDDFPLPDEAYFNKNSLNPTQIITIGDGNPTPFNQSTGQ